jgi:serine/threonine-protein kinase
MSRVEIAEIGKYRILGRMGEGAMGVVYRALDPVLNRPVAIKVMSDALARDSDLRGRFLREAQSAGSLQHPNVITIYDFGEVDGHPFIAMEFVEGADLHEILQTNSRLSLVEKVDVLIDVLNGLSYAHKHGIVHRDVKPANIRIDEEGRARIMDFGIAHLNSSSMTRPGMMVGTPAYMSPEQITGSSISASTDIFSMGAVMYELFTGIQAFHGETLQSVMYKIVSAPAPELKLPPGTLTRDQTANISRMLNSIVARALAKEPSERFENALRMAAALSDVRVCVLESREAVSSTSLRASVARVMADAPESRAGRARRRRVMGTLIGTGLVAATIAITFMARGRGAPSSLSSSGDVSAPPSAPTGTPVIQSPQAAAANPPPVPPAPTRSTARGNTPSSPVSPSAKEVSLFHLLQSTTLDTRRRAVEAGASAAQLDSGDDHSRLANALALEGKTGEAADHLNQAATLWGAAARVARAASNSTATALRTSAAEPPKSQVIPSPPVAAAPPPQVKPQATQQGPPVAPAPNPAADVGAVVAAYARALESRDLTAVRRAYPGITSAQATGWEQFFSSLRSLRVSLSVSGLDVNGATADTKVVGTYDYVTGEGKVLQQPVSFQASFRREGTVWLLVAVR